MYCGNCGHAVIARNKYCVGCGAPVASSDAASSRTDGFAWEQPSDRAYWLHPTGAVPQSDVAARMDTELARAAYIVLASYGLTSLEDARNAMPPDQYDYVLTEAQELAIKNTRHSRIDSGRKASSVFGGPGNSGNRSGSARSGSSAAAIPHPSLAFAIMILGLLLAVALLWRGWDAYHAGQVIDKATNLLSRLAGSQGQQVTSFLSSLTGDSNDYEVAGQAIMVAGMACATGAAFAFARPKVSIGGFAVAAVIALSATGSGDVTLFGVGAAVLAGLSIYAIRKRA